MLEHGPGGSRFVEPPATTEGKPWKLGAWALYEQRGPGEMRGYIRIAVVAQDACGLWIAYEETSYLDRWRWKICFGPKAEPRVAIFDGFRGPQIFDLRRGEAPPRGAGLDAIVAKLLPTHGLDGEHEDIDVPGGHFKQAIHVADSNVAGWVHPDVPFDGTVRRLYRDGPDILLDDYGECLCDSAVIALSRETARAMQPKPLPFTYFSIGVGRGHLSGHANERPSDTSSFRLDPGIRVTETVDAIVHASFDYADTYSPDPSTSQSLFGILVGARWAPWRRPVMESPWLPPGASAIYFQSDLGYTELARDTSTDHTTAARGIAFGGSIGWIWMQGDWGLGVAADDHVFVLSRNEGIRNTISLTWVLQLYLPP